MAKTKKVNTDFKAKQTQKKQKTKHKQKLKTKNHKTSHRNHFYFENKTGICVAKKLETEGRWGVEEIRGNTIKNI